MRVIEQFRQGKAGKSRLCEDLVFVSKDFGAVIDGATDKTRRTYEGMPGGLFAAMCATHVFQSLDAHADIQACADAITTELLAALHNSNPRLNTNVDDGPAAVFVAYSAARPAIWRMGDL